MDLKITYDLSGWTDLLVKAKAEAPAALSRALNRTGDMVVTAIGRELASETGMGVRDVREHIEADKSSPGNLVYEFTISGEYTSLADYDPHQTREGISARPWAHRRTFPGTFMGPNEQVYRRLFETRLPIKKLYGPNLAVEFGRGNSEAVAREKVRQVMPVRLAHELSRVLPFKGPFDESDDTD
jgi:hypothetical protein